MIFDIKLKININKIKSFKIKKINQITVKELYELLFNDYVNFKHDYIESFLGYNQADGYYWVTVKDNQVVPLQAQVLSGDYFILLCINVDIISKYIYYFENLYISNKLKYVDQDTYNFIRLLINILEEIPSKIKVSIKNPVRNVEEALNKIKIVPKKEKRKRNKLTIKTFLKETKKNTKKAKKIRPVFNIISKKESISLKIKKNFKKIKNHMRPTQKITDNILKETRRSLTIKNFINKIPEKKAMIKPLTSEKRVPKESENTKLTVTPKDIKKDFQNVDLTKKKKVIDIKIKSNQFQVPIPDPLETKTNLKKNQSEKDKPQEVIDIQVKSSESSSISNSLLDLPVDKKPKILIIEELEPDGNKLFILQTENKKLDSPDTNMENKSENNNVDSDKTAEHIKNLIDSSEEKKTLELNQFLPEKPKETPDKDGEKKGTITYIVNGYDQVIWNEEISITDEYTSVIDIINNSGLPVSIGTNLIDGEPSTYITGIAGIYNEGNYAWMLKVDDEVPMMSASAIKLIGKKSIVWEYVNWKDLAVDEEVIKEEDKLLNFNNNVVSEPIPKIKNPKTP